VANAPAERTRAPGVAARLAAPGFLLPFIIFWSSLDRTILLPIVPVVARDLDSTVVAAGLAVTAHAIAYSALQLVWGPLSTRWGRVKVLWVSTLLAGLANLLNALVPSMATFAVARTLSGGAFAATFAAVLTYFADTLPPQRRHAAMSNLAAASAIGLAGGSLVAATLDQWFSWRWTYAGFGLVTLLLVPVIARLPQAGDHAGEDPLAQLREILRSRWVLIIYALVALEGFLYIGVLNFLPVALQQAGGTVLVSGLVTGVFGLSVVTVSQAMKLFVGRVAPSVLFLAAAVAGLGAFAVVLWRIDTATVLSSAALIGAAWSLAHTTLQTWIATAGSRVRALGMTFFSISLMLGGAAGSAAGSFAAGHAGFPALFAVSTGAALSFGLLAAWGRSRYRENETISRR
jgi:DHA1 family inner membrane transport protein